MLLEFFSETCIIYRVLLLVFKLMIWASTKSIWASNCLKSLEKWCFNPEIQSKCKYFTTKKNLGDQGHVLVTWLLGTRIGLWLQSQIFGQIRICKTGSPSPGKPTTRTNIKIIKTIIIHNLAQLHYVASSIFREKREMAIMGPQPVGLHEAEVSDISLYNN
jgi:hypothetical protein